MVPGQQFFEKDKIYSYGWENHNEWNSLEINEMICSQHSQKNGVMMTVCHIVPNWTFSTSNHVEKNIKANDQHMLNT